MTVANCKRCGRIFNRVRRDICPACITDEDKVFIKVRDYLREHKNAFMKDVVEGAEVDMDMLIQMIQNGRIILVDNPNIGYECERCGGFTQSGRFCANCTSELASSLTDASEKLKLKSRNKNERKYFSR